MKIEEVVNNVNVYGLEDSVRGAKFSMAVDVNAIDGTITETTHRLANSPMGSGHDNFMNGIIVQFDLTFTNKAWVEAERYHFFDFVSSQSTMHRITKNTRPQPDFFFSIVYILLFNSEMCLSDKLHYI